MNWFEALVLGLIQGLTEYLPVSSSGHLAIGAHLFGINGEDNLTFTIMVHVATVLSTLVILWKEIDWILKGLFKFQMNEETKYALNIVISMIPVGVVGLFFKDQVEEIFGYGLLQLVGMHASSSAVFLPSLTSPSHARRHRISFSSACIHYRSRSGIAYCLVFHAPVLPLLPVFCWVTRRRRWLEFSFLMVIPPSWVRHLSRPLVRVSPRRRRWLLGGIDAFPMIVGFVVAFVSGCLACKWMINIVPRTVVSSAGTFVVSIVLIAGAVYYHMVTNHLIYGF